jgi:hypothetical protein
VILNPIRPGRRQGTMELLFIAAVLVVAYAVLYIVVRLRRRRR